MNEKKTFWRSKRFIAICVLALIVLTSIPLAVTKPPVETLQGHISEELIVEAKKGYAFSSVNYIVLNLARGRNVNTAVAETYLGFAGNVYDVSHGVGKTMANILFWMPQLLKGTQITISLTIVSVTAGLFASIFLALGKISRKRIINRLCSAYIFFFRGTPLLMQLYFIYYGLPAININLAINSKFLAAFIAFALNSAAYCAEIIRAAIQSIDKGQSEASRALGLGYGQTMRLVIIPQSIRRLIPPVSNEFIMVIKDASLVSLIALSDLTHTTRSIQSSSSSALVFLPAMVIYLIITVFFSFIFGKLEKRFSVYQ